jgi:hypothetical protein
MQKNTARLLTLGLIASGALARVLPHLPNFTPVGSFSMFGGARLRGWQAWIVPLALMAITDPFVGGYSATTPFVYASFLIAVWIGTRLRSTESPLLIGTAAVICSLQFFLITNFGSWLSFPQTYAHTWAGLGTCYLAALPFYGRTLASELLYSGALFGLHSWLSRSVMRERVAVA